MTDNIENTTEVSTTETSENMTEMPQGVPAAKGNEKKKHSFGIGFTCGMVVMFLLCVATIFILMLNKRVYLSGGAGLADSELVAKADSIAAYLQEYSIYDYDPDALREGMLDGLMAGTGDKYAQYYTAEELAAVFDDYEGNFCGIGSYIKETDDGDVYCAGVYENSPAEEAGLQEGDIFKAVDGESVEGLGKYDVASLIKGEENTSVVLTVYRESTDETLDLTITRRQLPKVDVEYEMVSDDIGYIWIKDFDEIAIEQFEEAMADLRSQGMKDLVLDLRNNTGGLLRAAIDITKQIMCKGVIVSIEDADGNRKAYDCDGRNEFEGRIVILTDGYTASASEIVAGALRDNGMAITMGTNTYGKGIVQNFYYLSDGSGIKFTTDQYYTPNGTAIHGIGIAPDIEVKPDLDAYKEDGTDNQLNAAIDYLENR
jgi:carboxyl-terminal processing protease